MATYSVNVTQSFGVIQADISASEATVFAVTNSLAGASYLTLETVRNSDGFYSSSTPKNTSGSFSLGTGVTNIIQSDYIAAAVIQPGGGIFTFTPASYVSASSLLVRGVGPDPLTQDIDAMRFFMATGITGATEQAAVNTLVTSLKGAGIWSKMKAVYPFVTDNRNLLSYTEDFVSWALESGTLTGGQLDPNGGLTAYKYTSVGGGLWANRNFMQPGVTYAQSIWVKSANGQNITVNLSNGYDYTGAQNFTVTGTWQRITNTAVFGQGSMYIAGLSSGNEILVWHPQLEVGSTATTYQPIATTQQAYISNQMKYNLVNPVDSDAAFRLVFNGGWTFANTGATPNGTNGYADTKLVPNTNLTLNSVSFSWYSRNNFTPVANQSLGCSSNSSFTPLIGTSILPAKSVNSYVYNYLAPDLIASSTGQNLAAMFIATRTSASSAKEFRNTTQLAAVTTQGQTTQPTNSFTFGAFRNTTGFQDYCTYEHAFAHIGDGLTDTEASNFYTAVQAFQTTLGRQV